jgi:hypothetical protein
LASYTGVVDAAGPDRSGDAASVAWSVAAPSWCSGLGGLTGSLAARRRGVWAGEQLSWACAAVRDAVDAAAGPEDCDRSAGGRLVLGWQRSSACAGRPLLCGSAEVVSVAARSGRVTERRRVPGTVVRFARSKAEFVLLAAPRNRIGLAKLVVAGGGRLRTVKLARVEAGLVPGSLRNAAISTDRFPGLAVDGCGRIAYVADPDGAIATVSLSSLRLSYHRPGTSRTLFDRLDGWLEPIAEAKGDRGPWRQAQWLGDGLLAVTGTNWQATGSVSGTVISETLHERPAGLEIVNTRTWQHHTLDPNADTATVTNGLLLATGTRWDVTPGKNRTSGEGLVAYDAQGHVRFRLFTGRSVYVNVVIDQRAYLTVTAPSGHQHEYSVDLRTRRVTATPDSQWPWLLLGAAQPDSG